MKYIDEYRDGELAQRIAARIREEAHPDRSYRFMEFCGGHTHAISRYGVSELLPDNVRMIPGPGCPVCVLPIGRIDLAVKLALEHGAILCSYGDTLRVPASEGLSLLRAKAHGADIRMIYSPLDALKIAEANPERQVVFFAIGFETTTPPTALIIREAAARGLDNFSVLCCHVLTPAAISHILAAPEKDAESAVELDGFVGPAHVSIVIGSAPYEAFARYDAEVRFDLEYQAVPDHKACECGAILRGQKKPTDCRLFGTVCTPENPMGSCMVSNEGACAAHYAYGRYKDIEVVAL